MGDALGIYDEVGAYLSIDLLQSTAVMLAIGWKTRQASSDIVIGILLIPGVNDDAQRLSEIGEFIAALPRKHPVDLLPYHAAAAGKYKKLGIDLRGANVTPASTERIAEIAHHLSGFGLTVRVGG